MFLLFFQYISAIDIHMLFKHFITHSNCILINIQVSPYEFKIERSKWLINVINKRLSTGRQLGVTCIERNEKKQLVGVNQGIFERAGA